MRVAVILFALTAFGLGTILFATPGTEIDFTTTKSGELVQNTKSPLESLFGRASLEETASTTETATSTTATTTKEEAAQPWQAYEDSESQSPLANPPEVIKAIYATGWSAGSEKKVQYFIDLIKSTELNAIVIDIKDYSGHVLYDIQNEDVIRYRGKQVQIPRVNALIKRFHDEGIYVIARQTLFQDPVLAKARPDLAIQKDEIVAPAVVETNGTTTMVITPTSTRRVVWLDNKGLGWIDPGAKEAWNYNIAIAKDAAARGFDEINFDYIRFPSDGALSAMRFPHYNAATTLKQTQIKRFMEYLRSETKGIIISADLFGLVTVNNDDLGIGQNLKDAAPYFEAITPMVYPSHYARGFIGFQNPGAHPYEVVKYSMEKAREKLTLYNKKCHTEEKVVGTSTISEEVCETNVSYMNTKLRPWLQDFDLGADYDAEKVRAQIRAVDEMVKDTPLYGGWMLWNPSNVYTKGAFLVE